MSPDQLLPASAAGAGALFFAVAFGFGYLSQHARSCTRTAFYAMLSAGSTIAGAALIFGNFLAIFLTR